MILESVNFAVAPCKCESAVIKLWKFNLQGVYTLKPNLCVSRTDIIARSSQVITGRWLCTCFIYTAQIKTDHYRSISIIITFFINICYPPLKFCIGSAILLAIHTVFLRKPTERVRTRCVQCFKGSAHPCLMPCVHIALRRLMSFVVPQEIEAVNIDFSPDLWPP